MKRRLRPGFTLVELAVVIVCIVILIGLLIPAMGSGQPAARRLECANNLKQMGLGVQNFHSTHGRLPPARWADGHPTFFVLLLPFMEEKEAYELWDTELSYGHGSNKQARNQSISAYTCPTRRAGGISKTSVPGAVGDYAGCAGNDLRGPLATARPWYSNPAIEGLRAPGSLGMMVTDPAFESNGSSTGPGDQRRIAWEPQLQFSNIIDGLSNTFLIGEKHVTIQGQMKLPGDGSIYNGSRMDNFCRAAGFSGDPQKPGKLNLAQGPEDTTNCKPGGASCDSFGSWHPGVVQFALGDGSVQKIKVDIDIDVLNMLAVRDDQGEISANY